MVVPSEMFACLSERFALCPGVIYGSQGNDITAWSRVSSMAYGKNLEWAISRKLYLESLVNAIRMSRGGG